MWCCFFESTFLLVREVAILGGRFAFFFSQNLCLYTYQWFCSVVVGWVMEGLKFSLCQFNKFLLWAENEQGPLSWVFGEKWKQGREAAFRQKAAIRSVHIWGPTCPRQVSGFWWFSSEQNRPCTRGPPIPMREDTRYTNLKWYRAK